MHTPAKGSPERVRTSKMSPTLAASGLEEAKSLVRKPDGSREAIWEASKVVTGEGHLLYMAGGGGLRVMRRIEWPEAEVVC